MRRDFAKNVLCNVALICPPFPPFCRRGFRRICLVAALGRLQLILLMYWRLFFPTVCQTAPFAFADRLRAPCRPLARSS